MIRTAAKALALLAAPLIAAVPAGAEVTESSPTHFVVRHAVDVDATPEDAWLALIAPGDWWKGHSGEAAAKTAKAQLAEQHVRGSRPQRPTENERSGDCRLAKPDRWRCQASKPCFKRYC